MKHNPRIEIGSMLIVMGIVSICLAASGCINDVAPENPTANKLPKKLPKLYLHCPKSFPQSVQRMREIYDSIFSVDSLPKPKTIKVVEIVHGEGTAAHSHYHLAEQQPVHAHLHEQPTDEKIHEVQIDVFTEFRDLAHKLPEVSADGDMKEADWLAVKDASKQIIETFDSLFSKRQSDEQLRAALQAKKNEINEILRQLEKHLASSDNNETESQQDQ